MRLAGNVKCVAKTGPCMHRNVTLLERNVTATRETRFQTRETRLELGETFHVPRVAGAHYLLLLPVANETPLVRGTYLFLSGLSRNESCIESNMMSHARK